MRLTSITAKNFRSLGDLSLEFSPSYCTISGRNNAGKSSVIRLLAILFRANAHSPFSMGDGGIEFTEDQTQWNKSPEPIVVEYSLVLSREADPALIAFVERIASLTLEGASPALTIRYTTSPDDSLQISVHACGVEVDEASAKEIDKRIKDSRLLFLYNSTTPHDQYFFGRSSRRRMFYDFVMSDEEKKALEAAGKQTERKLKSFAKQHTQELSAMLGRLSEKYDVEVAPPEGYAVRRMPLGINLRDKHVEVPLDDWGSGTQNRTHILMAILQANRIKTTDAADEKITPIVVVEEPESFLHPSAQAEFGRMLRDLSSEFGIQIIATTHSPYMLNLEEPSANILLCREQKRKKNFNTVRVDTTDENWMAPFAEHLGISTTDFSPLKTLFTSSKKAVLLVEGPIDQQYFELFQSGTLPCEQLRDHIDVVPYGGKDTLKNTLLLQFVLRNFEQLYVTFDLDAKKEVTAPLERLGLEDKKHFLALGEDQAGKDCIEGLLPQRVLANVNGRETDLVMQLGSRDNKERKKAEDTLKKMYLEEFRQTTDLTADDVKALAKAVRQINAGLPK
jgi:putative ATP-dependent endonuclease of OLD family